MTRPVRLILLAVLALALTASVTAFADDSRTAKQKQDDKKASGRSGDRPGSDDRRGDRKGDRRGKGGRASVYTIPGDTVFPEGIAVSDRGRGRTFFVSSTTDGAIFKGDTKRAAMTPFAAGGADGRTAAVGLKADRRNLFVAGGDTGKAFVLSQKDGSTVKVLDSKPAAGQSTFLNDVVLAGKHAYFTDSMRPVILRVSRKGGQIGELEPWLDLTGTVFQYQDGFNANGIESFDDGRLLVAVQSNTGELFRIDTRTKQVSQIDLGGATVKNGDGLVRKGSRLFVVQNDNRIAEIKLRDDKRKGTIRGAITSDTFAFPTTAARDGDRLLVVNAQFDKRGGTPVLPFSVTAVRAKSAR